MLLTFLAFIPILVASVNEIISFAETLPQNIETANNFIATKSFFGYKIAEIFDFPDLMGAIGGLAQKFLNKSIDITMNIAQISVFLIVFMMIVFYFAIDKPYLEEKFANKYSYEDIMIYKSELKVKENGKLRMEGKEYVVKDGEVYQLTDASSSSMSYCNVYIGAMRAIKRIVTYSNDTFEMAANFINGSFVSYDNTNSGLSATNVQDALDGLNERLLAIEALLDISNGEGGS